MVAAALFVQDSPDGFLPSFGTILPLCSTKAALVSDANLQFFKPEVSYP
jgi:hypothetical protein